MNLITRFLTLLVAVVAQAATPAVEPGFTALFNGRDFTGWKIAGPAETFTIQDGAIVAKGAASHCYYDGSFRNHSFRNFELKVDVMTEPGSNGGIYFHTRYQESGWPKEGFECQVNVSQSDWIKTGSLYGVANIALTPTQDNKWWTQHIIVKGNRVTVKIDGKTVLEYNEPAGVQPGREFSRKIGEGTFALQAHDPKSVVRYKNIRVKRT